MVCGGDEDGGKLTSLRGGVNEATLIDSLSQAMGAYRGGMGSQRGEAR